MLCFSGLSRVIYDPLRRSDSEFVEEMVSPVFKEAKFCKLPHAGHAVLHYVKSAGVLSEFLNSIINNFQFIEVPFDHKNPVYMRNKFQRFLRKKKVKNAEKIMQMADGKLRVEMEKELMKHSRGG